MGVLKFFEGFFSNAMKFSTERQSPASLDPFTQLGDPQEPQIYIIEKQKFLFHTPMLTNTDESPKKVRK